MKILYLAPIAYNNLKQRPQHIADILSRENEVWYVEPTISLMKYVLKGGETFKSKKVSIRNNLHVIKANGFFSAHISLQALNIFHYNIISERLQLKKYLQNADIIWVGYSGWFHLIENMKDKLIVYDKMDDDANITENSLMKKLLLKVEPQLIMRADIIFVTAMKFYKELSIKKKNVYLLPNAVCEDIEYIEKDLGQRKKRVFGYVGTVAHWFDVKAIEIILNNNSNNEVVIVGPNYLPKINKQNVTYLGVIDKECLPNIIADFDVCLYPFKKNSFLDTIDPVKIYEYLALNKPVLAVNSAEIEKFDRYVETYDDYKELELKVEKSYKKPFNEDERIDFIKKNCWSSRVAYALTIINDRRCK